MKKVLYLAIAALVALMLLMPAAVAEQQQEIEVEEEVVVEREAEVTPVLPKAGGPVPLTSSVLPAAALLIGSGVLVYAVLRRR